MDLITVDKTKCVRCGICVDCCPACILTMGEEGPECNFDRGCMSCGQCTAICPTGALENKYAPKEKQIPVPQEVFSAEQAMNFLRSRRSVRNFKEAIPSEEEICRVMEAARYAPTATNSQGMYYIVIRNRETIRQIAELVACWMEEEIAKNSPAKRYFSIALRAFRERGQDIITRNCPVLVFATAKRLHTSAASNAELSFTYANLYAASVGLGSCIAGFVGYCGASGYKPLIDLIGLPAKFKVAGAMMLGYPKYKYKRMPERQHLKIEFRN